MDLRQELRRRQKDMRFVFGGLMVLLVVFTGFYYLLQRGQGLPQVVLANRLLLFVLWYVNVILILTILFILFRSFFRLLVDRHNRILGSKFKTKLVASAILLSLIPVLIPFPFATHFLVDSFDQWFNLPIDEVLGQAAETAEALTAQIEKTNLRDARRVLVEIEDLDLDDLRQQPELLLSLQRLRDELELDYLAVFDGLEAVHAIANPQVLRREPEISGLERFLEEAVREGEAIHVESSLEIEGRLILAARSSERLPGEHAVAVTGTMLPPDIASKSESLQNAYRDYLQVRAQKEDLRMSYLLILLMVTLLVVVAFSSIGLRLTRRVTTPIQALAEGTRRISNGDLDHRVEVAVDDELGVLVSGFNRMTGELQRNRELVESSHRKLREANRRVRAVLDNVAAGVLSIDPTGVIRTCNGAALSILHQRVEEVIGHSILAAWKDPERGKLIPLLEQETWPGAMRAEQLRITVGGVWKTLEVKVTVLPDSKRPPDDETLPEAPPPGGWAMVLEDLTELIHAQKMATWNEVARRIAHEIKNPLTPIKLTAERLLYKHQQGDPELGRMLEDGVEVIVREVATLKGLVDEFSRYARMPRPRPRDVDLESFVAETLKLYRDIKPGVEITADIDPTAAWIRFDPEQLKSVLTNLLDNAISALEPPGTVRVSSERRDGVVLLHVEDTGPGIPDEDKDKLFLPYYSTKGRGTGLGLAIVQRIVAEHEARIQVEDNEPRGTIFTLEIPLG